MMQSPREINRSTFQMQPLTVIITILPDLSPSHSLNKIVILYLLTFPITSAKTSTTITTIVEITLMVRIEFSLHKFQVNNVYLHNQFSRSSNKFLTRNHNYRNISNKLNRFRHNHCMFNKICKLMALMEIIQIFPQI